MTDLTINYLLHSDDSEAEVQLLGVERLVSIKEKLIPSFTEEGHKVSITKFFDGIDDHRWLVKNLVHNSDTETSVYLDAWTNNRHEEFLSQTKKSNRTVVSKLQFGTLVEVEFGFIPISFSNQVPTLPSCPLEKSVKSICLFFTFLLKIFNIFNFVLI